MYLRGGSVVRRPNTFHGLAAKEGGVGVTREGAVCLHGEG